MSLSLRLESAPLPSLDVAAELRQLVAGARLPEPLGFGQLMAPVMAIAYYRNGAWETPRLARLDSLPLAPHTQALHYGQAIFEGMKAYRNLGSLFPDCRALLFRPHEHARRFNRSAARLGMPAFDEDWFVETLQQLVTVLDPLIPNELGQSLYLRPVMFGATPHLSVVPSTEYCFAVVAAPSDAFFTQPISAWIERQYSRAGPGGTGNVKAAGNYAASFAAADALRRHGFHQLLWLDAVSRSFVEEFTAMNVFVRRGGRIQTPPLSDTILAGITRDSLLSLGSVVGAPMEEAPIAIEELLDAIRSGEDVEVFGCGTGAVVAPVDLLGDETGARLPIPSQATAGKLRTHLLNIQHGISAAAADWPCPVRAGVDALLPPLRQS
jgi:branched-chain amino acid aminotransferase